MSTTKHCNSLDGALTSDIWRKQLLRHQSGRSVGRDEKGAQCVNLAGFRRQRQHSHPAPGAFVRQLVGLVRHTAGAARGTRLEAAVLPPVPYDLLSVSHENGGAKTNFCQTYFIHVMHLIWQCFEELIRMGVWDFVVMLSGRDLALRNVKDMAATLAPYRGTRMT